VGFECYPLSIFLSIMPDHRPIAEESAVVGITVLVQHPRLIIVAVPPGR
jgi:hypothetical protein